MENVFHQKGKMKPYLAFVNCYGESVGIVLLDLPVFHENVKKYRYICETF